MPMGELIRLAFNHPALAMSERHDVGRLPTTALTQTQRNFPMFRTHSHTVLKVADA